MLIGSSDKKLSLYCGNFKNALKKRSSLLLLSVEIFDRSCRRELRDVLRLLTWAPLPPGASYWTLAVRTTPQLVDGSANYKSSNSGRGHLSSLGISFPEVCCYVEFPDGRQEAKAK